MIPALTGIASETFILKRIYPETIDVTAQSSARFASSAEAGAGSKVKHWDDGAGVLEASKSQLTFRRYGS